MAILRQALLRASRSRWLERQVRRRGFVRRAVARFMPGETLDDALAAAEAVRGLGISTLLTLLGENVSDPAEAEAVARHYLEVLDRAAERRLDAQISVKLTQLGLDLGVEKVRGHLGVVARRAAERGSFVWLDMEDSSYTDRTLEIYTELRERHSNVGVCLQAYLRRSERDLSDLLPLRPAIRVVKGAYREPKSLAFPRRSDVDRNYLRLAARLLEAARTDGPRPAFGTHDLRLIEEIGSRAQAMGLPKERYEFEMLYGIQRGAQARLAREGYRMRVLISYGSAWFPWYMRRLAERPANLWFVVRNLFAR